MIDSRVVYTENVYNACKTVVRCASSAGSSELVTAEQGGVLSNCFAPLSPKPVNPNRQLLQGSQSQ